MPISKLARVRVEAFSNTIPRTRPGRVACGWLTERKKRNSSARLMSASISPSARSQKLRKSRLRAIIQTMAEGLRELFPGLS